MYVCVISPVKSHNSTNKTWQGVVEDQFLLGSWAHMRVVFGGLFRFLLSPRESWSLKAAPPWCVEHATIRPFDPLQLCKTLHLHPTT